MHKVEMGKADFAITGPLFDGTHVRQSFVAEGDKLLSVDVYFATYAKQLTGIVTLEIIDAAKTKIASAVFNTSLLKDNSFREIAIDARLNPGQTYELRLWTNGCRSGESPTCAYGKSTRAGHFLIGGKAQRAKELYCVFNYEKRSFEIESFTHYAQHGVFTPVKKPLVFPRDVIVSGLISVVIPHYNCHTYLQKCLVSLAKQTYKCIEVIIVDDGSTDYEQAEIVANNFKGLLPIILFVRMDANQGAPSARNRGAAMAKGEYLFFCDADVELFPNSLEILIKTLMQNQDCDFTYGGFEWGTQKVPPIPFDIKRLFDRNYITTMSLLRSVNFPKFDETLKRHQDWDLWLTMVENGSLGVCCGKYLFATPMREGGITSDKNITMSDSILNIRRKHGSAKRI